MKYKNILLLGLCMVLLAGFTNALVRDTGDITWNDTVAFNNMNLTQGGWLTFDAGEYQNYTNEVAKEVGTLSIGAKTDAGANKRITMYFNGTHHYEELTMTVMTNTVAQTGWFGISPNDVFLGASWHIAIGANWICLDGGWEDTGVPVKVNEWYKVKANKTGTMTNFFINLSMENPDWQICNFTYASTPINGSAFRTGDLANTKLHIANVTLRNYSEGGAPPPAPGAEGISVIIDYPTDSAGFNAVNLSAMDNTIWINGTHNETIDTTCAINDTSWTIGSNATHNFTFYNVSALTNQFYYVNVTCNKTGTLNGSTVKQFRMDTSVPLIITSINLTKNSTVVYNGTLSAQVNFTDNIEIYNVTAWFGNETIIYTNSNLAQNNYQLNISQILNNDINHNFTVRVCDAHTATQIDDIDTEISKGGIKFVMEREWIFLDKEYIHIYPKDYSMFETPLLNRYQDRYGYTFNRKTNTAGTEVFIVKSSQKIDIVQSGKYKAHLVIQGINNGYWLDFENDDVTSYSIKRISDNEVEVTLNGLTGKGLTFNSVGELNCVEQVFEFGNLNPIFSHIEFVSSGSTNDFGLDVNKADTMSVINATLFYNNTLYYGGITQNYSLEVTAPKIGADINSTNISFNWIVNVDNFEFNLSTFQQNVSDFFIDNCTIAETYAINFSLVNISSGAYLNGVMELYFNYHSGETYKNYSISVTHGNQTICIFPNSAEIYSDIHIDYSVGGSNTFTYISNGTLLDNITDKVNLYVTDDTTLVTFSVKDSDNTEISGAQIKVLEWDVGTGTFRLASQLETDFAGKAYGYLNLDDTWYKFIITYQGAVVLETDPTKVTSTTVNFIINLASDYYDEAVSPIGIYAAITFDNASRCFTCSYDSLGGYGDEICLKIERQSLNGIYQINQTCTTSDSGAILRCIGAEAVNTSTYVGTCFITIDENPLIVAIKSISFDYAYKLFDKDGVFASFLIISTITMIGLWNMAVAIILMLLGFVTVTSLGFFSLSKIWLTTLVILGGFAIWRMNRK